MQTLLRTGPDLPPGGGEGPAQPGGRGAPGVLVAWVRSGSAVTFLVVAGVTAFVVTQLRPGLLLGPNMDVGGDNAAHVVAVHYFIHHLLAHGELSGWDPQWFGGFPLYVFYFPFPALLVAAVNLVAPYAVAFKLVSVLGLVAMPFAAWAFGQLSGFARPTPAVMAAAMVPFLFNTSYTIDGGNIASTLAGEFSFTIALAFALVFLGVLARSLRTGRLRWLAAALFCATLLSHVVPALFAAGGAVLLTLALPDRAGRDPTLVGRARRLAAAYRRPLGIVVGAGLVGALLAAFWLLPFGAYLRYTSSMGYQRVAGFQVNFLPDSAEVSVQALAVVGALFGVLRRERTALVLVVLAAGSVGAFFLLPSGLVYNARWLPFWFVTTALLAAYGLTEGAAAILRILSASPRRALRWHLGATPVLGGLAAVGITAAYLGALPIANAPAATRSFIPDWVSWNYSGYQAKTGWSQFGSLVSMLERVARTHGCGRLDYEYSPNTTDAFGSTLVPMSFPLWTHGCIASEEGVYYESSTSTPFHFLDQSELSLDASNPVVGLPYQGLDVADGIRHLQLTGVKYFLASSPTVEEQAAADPSLVEVGSSPESASVVDRAAGSPTPPASSTYSFVLYEIRHAPLVTPLRYEPVVEAGLSKTAWLSMAISWYQDESLWPVPVVASGPPGWRRAGPGALVGPAGARPVPPTRISSVASTADAVSFRVSRIGTPVVVKVPYFPAWQATGATGPYETTPNVMVVVPTSHLVTLHYATTTVDWLGSAGSVLGLVGLGVLFRSTAPAPPPPVPLAPPEGTGAAGQATATEGDAEPEAAGAGEEGAGPGPGEGAELGGADGGTETEAGSDDRGA